MTLVELWNVMDKGLPIGSWIHLPDEIRKKSPEFMLQMGAEYSQGCWVLTNPETFMGWAASTGLWSDEEVKGMTPYVAAFLLRDG